MTLGKLGLSACSRTAWRGFSIAVCVLLYAVLHWQHMERQWHVDVITPDGQVTHLTGRAARFVLWLCQNMEKVNRVERGELVLGFRGDLGTYRLTEAGEM